MDTKQHTLFTTGSNAGDARREAILDWLETHIRQVLCDLGLIPIQAWDPARLRALQAEAHQSVQRAIQTLDQQIPLQFLTAPYTEIEALKRRRQQLAQWPGLPDPELILYTETTRDRLIVSDRQIIGLIDLYADKFMNETPYVSFYTPHDISSVDTVLDLDELPWFCDPYLDALPEWNFESGGDDACFFVVPSIGEQCGLRPYLKKCQSHCYRMILVSDQDDIADLAASLDVLFVKANI